VPRKPVAAPRHSGCVGNKIRLMHVLLYFKCFVRFWIHCYTDWSPVGIDAQKATWLVFQFARLVTCVAPSVVKLFLAIPRFAFP